MATLPDHLGFNSKNPPFRPIFGVSLITHATANLTHFPPKLGMIWLCLKCPQKHFTLIVLEKMLGALKKWAKNDHLIVTYEYIIVLLLYFIGSGS